MTTPGSMADKRCESCHRPTIYVHNIGWLCNNLECEKKGVPQ